MITARDGGQVRRSPTTMTMLALLATHIGDPSATRQTEADPGRC